MKDKSLPFAKLSKLKQQRKIQKDIEEFIRNGGHIKSIKKGKADGLCCLKISDLEMRFGFYRQI